MLLKLSLKGALGRNESLSVIAVIYEEEVKLCCRDSISQTLHNLFFLPFLHQHYLLKILTKDKEANVYFMNVCLWFIFLCGACVYNQNRLWKRKALFLLLSPDVNDKVSCGFLWLFDMHFKRGETSQPHRLICNGDFFFFLFLLLLSFSASESKNSQRCQASDKFVFL